MICFGRIALFVEGFECLCLVRVLNDKVMCSHYLSTVQIGSNRRGEMIIRILAA